MPNYNIVTETADATVVVEYKPIKSKSTSYQSEAQLETQFINMLQEQGYEYVNIHDEDSLIKNLRNRIEILNNYKFTDNEWNIFFKQNIANPNWGIEDKTRIIQEDYRQVLKRDTGDSKNITLIDKDNIHNNYLQVINQYVVDNGKHPNRYDVTILVNGLPLIHVELKRRGIPIKQAFDQINRYERESFWAGCGLYDYIQIFVISNGTHTKYYSNSTRWNHIKSKSGQVQKFKTSNSFEFTSFWADATNTIIPDLVDFTRTFFAKHTILNILTKYCVFTSEKLLLVMRPYQIVATERILNRIEISETYKKYGSIAGGGYIWHTTGSGKTLTSFKTARLATEIPYIKKVIFVVDRKDLDYQTMREYDRFEKGAANSNKSTAVLKKQLENDKSKIIITTIQKLSCFIKKNQIHDIYKERIVFIFDECHRSQFGEMHTEIIKHFKNYNLFGFTGTPIFAVNSTKGGNYKLKTTEQAFGDKLHTYTIIDAINDHNVLPFRVDYIKTIDMDENVKDKEVYDIDREEVYLAKERITLVTKYILEHFNQKTYRNEKGNYSHSVITNIKEVISSRKSNNVNEIKQKIIVNGFNSIFAVSSIEAAKKYYQEFKKQMAEDNKLKIALIYSYQPNEEEIDGILGEENSDDTTGLSQSDRDFLDGAIKDYNEMFNTSYDTSSDKFQNYYKDVSLRMKNRELDLLIVVDMFLTGFDATTLNTLWIDKKLRMHGLIQAYSRTNRILNSIKNFGNIICFRNLQKKTDEAIALFGDKEASGIVVLKGFKDYYEGYNEKNGVHKKGYVELIDDLQNNYPLGKQIIGEKNKKTFINLFGQILRVRNILSSFDEFKGKEILTEIDFQDYQSMYHDTWDELKGQIGETEDILDDVVFEAELLKSIEINIDYILVLVQKYHDSHCQDEEIRLKILKAVNSSSQLRSKKALIENFINGINDVEDVYEEWKHFLAEEQEKELMQIITEENLKENETRKFISRCFENGEVKTVGTDINKILPPVSRFSGNNAKREKKKNVLEKIIAFFEKFFGL